MVQPSEHRERDDCTAPEDLDRVAEREDLLHQ